MVVLIGGAGVAQADDVNGAAKAFSQAQEVSLAGDYARAADLYELADELAPSAPALRNAARARLAANHDAMAATLAAELLHRYPSDKESRAIAEAILSKLSPRLTQFEISCEPECSITIDGKAAASKPRAHHLLFAHPGARTIGATFDGDRQATKQVTAIVGKTVTLQIDAPPRPPAASSAPLSALQVPAVAVRADASTKTSRSHGLQRRWVFGAAVVTVGLGVAAGLEGLATLDMRAQIKTAVAAHDDAKAMSLYDDGRTLQTRTNVLLGMTAAAGISTIVLGVLTDWSGGSHQREISVVPANGGASVVFRGKL